MKTLGLIGGMSWESTAIYYRLINEGVKAKLGGYHSAKLVLYSVDFAAIEEAQRIGDWYAAARLLSSSAIALERAGAECIVLCTNTMHKVASEIEASIRIPFIHIADATAIAIQASGINTVGFMGTRSTMDQDFIVDRLQSHGIKVLRPIDSDRELIHGVIFDELVHGKIIDSSKQSFLAVIDRLTAQGAHGVVLGCTEIGMLIKSDDIQLHYFDTAAIHSRSAVEFALS